MEFRSGCSCGGGETGWIFKGRVVTFAQTAAGRTLSASGNGVGEQYASGLQYGANGAMVGAVWNGTGATRLVEARSYNWLGQMVTAEVSKAGTELKWKITNEYGNENNNGNLNKQWTETGVATYGVKFAYDSVNRIRGAAEDAANEAGLAAQSCSVVGGTWCVKYRADGYGNLWTENKSATAAGVAAVSQAAYDAATNRMTVAGYYANGNQKHWVLNEPKSRAEYDADGKMVKAGRVTLNDGVVWDAAQVMTTLTYNGAGQRVKKTVTQGAATQTAHYVYGLDGEVAAEWESAPTGVSGRQFLVGDHLGSTRVRLDGNGEVLQRVDYEPFGTEVQRPGVSGYSGSGEVARKFTGKERDGETGLDYFAARYMGSALGRFTTPDGPLVDQKLEDPRSWSLYGYARNNPMLFVDRNGKEAISPEECSKTDGCIVIKVGVVIDKNADIYGKDGHLRPDIQNSLDEQLARAKDEYGSAGISLDVSFASGTVTPKGIKGESNTAADVVVGVTDANGLGTTGHPAHGGVSKGGTGAMVVNMRDQRTGSGTIAHVMAHMFGIEGRAATTSNIILGSIIRISSALGNTAFDEFNDLQRSNLSGKAKMSQAFQIGGKSGIFENYFRSGARNIGRR